jgi:hypothetical protein
MKLANSLLAVAVAIASFGITISAKADTVNARCDVYPKGEDRATSSASCTFSQRQGAVSIELENGSHYYLTPVAINQAIIATKLVVPPIGSLDWATRGKFIASPMNRSTSTGIPLLLMGLVNLHPANHRGLQSRK